MIRVLVVDDHPVLRGGLAQLLGKAEGVDLVGLAADGEAGIELALDERPDVVLMDLEMPGLDGIEATRRIRASRPETQVVVLTSFSDRERILDALDAGAAGYLLKDAEPDDLLRSVHAAAAGEAPLAPRAASALLAERREARPATELTPREREVLLMVAEGLPNKLIARRLEISEATVKAHLTRIFERIGVSDRTQAALWAERHHLGERWGKP
jgi:DNA-binding NarL/FixJ family response regulator